MKLGTLLAAMVLRALSSPAHAPEAEVAPGEQVRVTPAARLKRP